MICFVFHTLPAWYLLQNDRGSRHDSVVVQARGFGTLAFGAAECRVTSETAHRPRASDVDKAEMEGFWVSHGNNYPRDEQAHCLHWENEEAMSHNVLDQVCDWCFFPNRLSCRE